MSEENTTEEDVSELRKAAEGGKAAKAEADALRRELAFTRAGIDTSTKVGAALLKQYDGDLTAEAITAEATEWGLVTPKTEEAPVTENTAPDYAEDAALQSMRDAANGAPAPDTQPEKSALEKALAGFEEDRSQGLGQNEATNRAIGRMIQAAAAGDKTAIFNPAAWEQKQQEAGHGAQFAR